jgi:hypothetical protein
VDPLPLAASCALDAAELRAQQGRYRRVGARARVIERTPRRIVVELDRSVGQALVEQTLAIERECCPFYELGWEPELRLLSIAVAHAEHAPALEAIAFSLGIDAPADGVISAP